MKLKNYFIIYFILVGSLGALLGGVNTYNNFIKSREKSAISELLSVAKIRSEYIGNYIERLITEANIIAMADSLNNEDLEKIVNTAEAIESVYVLDADGKVVATSGGILLGSDYSTHESFIKGKEETVIFFNHLNYPDASSDVRVMLVAIPFHDGVLLVNLNTNKIEDIVKDRTGLGETGEVLLAISESELGIEKNTYLFSKLFENEALNVENENAAEPMRQALLGNEMIFKNILDYRNEPVIAVSQYIDIENIGLVAKIDRAEIIESYHILFIKNILISGGMVIFVAILSGIFISFKISRPIKKLAKTAGEISEGNLDVNIDDSIVSEKNEIGELGALFNVMADNLREGRKNIEKKVADRTSELEQVNKYMIGRELKMIELKKEIKKLKDNK